MASAGTLLGIDSTSQRSGHDCSCGHAQLESFTSVGKYESEWVLTGVEKSQCIDGSPVDGVGYGNGKFWTIVSRV